MANLSRRALLGATAAAAGADLFGRRALGDPNGFPIGIQLYSVGEDLQKDFEGTLKALAEIGYRSVALTLDYNDFIVSGTLTSLEIKKPKPCP